MTQHKARAIISRALTEQRDYFNAELRARIANDRAQLAALIGPGKDRTRSGMRASMWAGEKVQTWADIGDIDAIMSECGPMVVALNVACKVLGIGPAERTAAAVDWQPPRP